MPIRFMTAIVLPLLLGACAQSPEEYARQLLNTGKWQQMEPLQRASAETISLTHTVRFPWAKATLKREEARKLDAFAMAIRSLDRRRTVLTLSGGGKDKGTLAASRRQAVLSRLAQNGITGKVLIRPDGTAEKSGKTGYVRITIDTVVVFTPDCTASGDQNTPGLQLGCSNEAALAAMIARPEDLSTGRKPSPADGEAQALTIQRYRTGDTKPLSTELSTGEQTQNPGGGPQKQ